MFKQLRKTLRDNTKHESVKELDKQLVEVSRKRYVLTVELLIILELIFGAISVGWVFILDAPTHQLAVTGFTILSLLIFGKLVSSKAWTPRVGSYVFIIVLFITWILRGVSFEVAMLGAVIFLNLVVHLEWGERIKGNIALTIVYVITVMVLYMFFDGSGVKDFLIFGAVVLSTLLLKKADLNDVHYSYKAQIGVLSDLSEVEEKAQVLEVKATRDKLTGIYNRGAFDDRLAELIGLASENQVCIGLIMIDIDYFKKYNDTYGHVSGDECLIEVARLIDQNAKRDNEFSFRYGGEEFAILVYDTDVMNLKKLANFIRRKVEDAGIYHESSDVAECVTLSLGGLLLWPSKIKPNGKTGEFLKVEADKCLYESKNRGRNRATVKEIGAPRGYDSSTSTRGRERRVNTRR